ncbi:hypothetical protein TIFTF001_055498, partial [Ficus carica]
MAEFSEKSVHGHGTLLCFSGTNGVSHGTLLRTSGTSGVLGLLRQIVGPTRVPLLVGARSWDLTPRSGNHRSWVSARTEVGLSARADVGSCSCTSF